MTTRLFVRMQLALDGISTVPDNASGIFAPAFLKRYTYKVKVVPKPGVQNINGGKSFEGKFASLRSAEHEFKPQGESLDSLDEGNSRFKVLWEIYFDGKLNHTVSGQFFDQSRLQSDQWTKFNIKFTKSNTRWSTGEPSLVTQTVSAGVGWYLVKKPEAFGDLMNRAFQKPSQIDWDVMKDVNTHLGELSTVTLLKPGQVVIFSRTKGHSNPKLQEMKIAAAKAQEAWKDANADGKIDAEEMVLLDLLMQGHKLLPIPATEVDGPLNEYLASAVQITDDQKRYIDSTLGLVGVNEAALSVAGASRQALADVAKSTPYTTEKGTVKRATKAAAQTHPKQFRLLNDSSVARKLIRWDTGIQAGRAKDYIKHEVQLRSAKANGGIGGLSKNLSDVGKYSKVLKGAGYVGIALEATSSGAKAYDAYGRGDVKGGNVEVGKGVGSIAGGVAGGALVFLVFGVVTGGLGLVCVGLVAAGVGYGSGKIGERLGQGFAQGINSAL